MSEQHRCPLCPETYGERTDLHVHLEVEHRKSEIVSYLVDVETDLAAGRIDDESPVLEEERSAPSA